MKMNCQRPFIRKSHMIVSRFDYLLKVRTADIQAYRRVLAEQISALSHLAGTSINVATEAVREGG
jgi:Lrp/AsnC family leucine-responsive transcriptional regulator